jgi:hypothetical protein
MKTRKLNCTSVKMLNYNYDSLPNSHSIRMLTIYPGELTDTLDGYLDVVDINHMGKYEALSYVWGKPTKPHRIHMNDKYLEITESLNDALKRLRLPDKPRRVWADQICINQGDLDERGQQVQYMNAIYKNASHVLVWLGRDDNEIAGTAFSLVRELAEQLADEEKRAHFHDLSRHSIEHWAPLNAIAELPWVS